MKAKRFTRQDGDLGTAEGQAKLWEMIHREQPRNIWVAPECKFWGNFSRWNSGRSPATAAKIQAGRNQQRVHLELCSDLYWYQVSRGRHFHLEQPQGSEATEQPELDEVVLGTYRTVFDMCEVGELKIPKGNNYLRKRTVVAHDLQRVSLNARRALLPGRIINMIRFWVRSRFQDAGRTCLLLLQSTPGVFPRMWDFVWGIVGVLGKNQ